MVAAAYPVNNCEERASLFRGSIQTALSNGLRPSAIYTDWFMAQDGKSAEFLPPLKHDFFERCQPEDGKLFDEEARYRVREITRRTREEWSLITRGLLLWTEREEEKAEKTGACVTQLVSRENAEEEYKMLDGSL